MTDEQYSGGDPTRAAGMRDGGDGQAGEAESAGFDESVAVDGGSGAGSADAAASSSAENSPDAGAAVERGGELSGSQAGQLAALETLFASIAAQQKQMMDLIARAVAENANTQAALADLRRSVELNAGQNQNDGRQGMQ